MSIILNRNKIKIKIKINLQSFEQAETKDLFEEGFAQLTSRDCSAIVLFRLGGGGGGKWWSVSE